MTDTPTIHGDAPLRYRVVGMDCARDAVEIERAARSAGVDEVKVSAATHIMTRRAQEADLPRIERAVGEAGYGFERIIAGEDSGGPSAAHQAPPATAAHSGSW